jgi:hypothetical protein
MVLTTDAAFKTRFAFNSQRLTVNQGLYKNRIASSTVLFELPDRVQKLVHSR